MARMDEYQQEAFDLVERLLAENATGVVKVKAGAGSGKTFVLARMFVASPNDAVGMSFTKKAGLELKERVYKINSRTQGFLGTSHSYAGRMLREHDGKSWDMSRCLSLSRRAPGLPSVPTLWNAIINWNRHGIPGLKQKPLGLKLPSGMGWKDYDLAAGKIYGAGFVKLDGPEAKKLIRQFDEDLPEFAKAFSLFRRSTKAVGGWTFDQQLHAGMVLLARGKGPRPPVVFIDEAQDNNGTQLRLAQELASRGLLVLIGDARQSIYAFRGAAVDTFIGLNADHEVELRANYRSRPEIVRAANRMCRDEDWADGSPSVAARKGRGVVREWRDDEEAVAGEILATTRAGRYREKDIAILCRTNSTATDYEMALRAAGLKVNRLGAAHFFELPLPQAFLYWCVLSEFDDLTALDAVANAPVKRYLGHAFIPAIQATEGTASGLMQALQMVSSKFKGAKEISKILTRIRRMGTWKMKLAAIEAMFAATLPPPKNGKKSGLHAQLAGIVRTATRLGSASAVEDALEAPVEPSTDGVVVSTVHRSKGLEWEVVYVDAKKSAYESVKADKPDSPAEFAESGRLAYVAVTRAREELVLVETRGEGLGSFFLSALEG